MNNPNPNPTPTPTPSPKPKRSILSQIGSGLILGVALIGALAISRQVLNPPASVQRLAAAYLSADAQHGLGFRYYYGIGAKVDMVEAARLFRLAANQGHAKSQYRLGTQYLDGKGLEQNYTEAVKWLRLAAEDDNVASSATALLIVCYKTGRGGVPRCEDEVSKLSDKLDSIMSDKVDSLFKSHRD